MPLEGQSPDLEYLEKGQARDTEIRFIDLFAGLGGIRIGFEQACKASGLSPNCVFTSEIKPSAIEAYCHNFGENFIHGDITKIPATEIPDFDYLLAGFPCQPFSSAGTRQGFADIRGTLFFDINRIIAEKKPTGFLLENVEGLVGHDKRNPQDEMGRTLAVILEKLRQHGYHVDYKVLDAAEFGVPQNRRRVYIVGHKDAKISLGNFKVKRSSLEDVLDVGLPTLETKFVKKLLSKFPVKDLAGKSIKDKRGGSANIHSWDIGIKGSVSKKQKQILTLLLRQRRKKKWAAEKGIQWMDGMPLTLKEIRTFAGFPDLKAQLDDLVKKGYLRFEHPKELVSVRNLAGKVIKRREYDTTKPKGYNIVVGKLSFEISKILDGAGFAPTLVATDVERLAVIDGDGLRRLTPREGLRLCGFPESYNLSGIDYKECFDLLGNTVVVNVIREISKRLVTTPPR